MYFRRRTKKHEKQPQSEQAETLVLPLSSNSSPSSLPPPAGNITPTSGSIELPLAQSRGHRVNAGKPPVRYGYEHDIAKYVSYSSVSAAYRTFVASLQAVPILKDWRCAKQDPKWKDAMKKSYLPFKRTKHGNLFIFQKERRRLVASGYSR